MLYYLYCHTHPSDDGMHAVQLKKRRDSYQMWNYSNSNSDTEGSALIDIDWMSSAILYDLMGEALAISKRK